MKFAGHFVLGLVATALSSCAGLNEGSTDIRRPGSQAGWFLATGAPGQAAVAPNEPVLITIDRMFIREFEETHFEPTRLPGKGLFQARGEIAVLVGVPNANGPASFTSRDGHYLVFYSNDVVEHQFLNVRNQRVFGPAAVGADRMEIEFLVLELDRSSNQEQALLTNLAALGKAYAGMGGPVGSVLTDLGTSLLGAQNDDVEMRYRFTFDLGARSAARLPLLPGYYVSIREDRTESARIDWSTICLDRETGHLFAEPNTQAAGTRNRASTVTFASLGTSAGFCGTSNASWTLYEAQSYVVFHVETGVSASSQAMTTFATFGDELEALTDPSIAAVGQAIERVGADYVMDMRKAQIWNALGALESAAATYGSLEQQAIGSPELSSARDAARATLMRASVALHRAFASEARTIDATPANDKPYDLAEYQAQIERLIDFFGSLSWAPTDQQAALLSASHDGGQFAEVFGTSDQFAQRVEVEVGEDWPTPKP